MAEDYEIVGRIVVHDASGPALASADTKAKALQGQFRGIGVGIGALNQRVGGLQGSIESMFGTMQRGLALAAGSAGIGMAIKSMVGWNSEIDTAERGMASILTALTGAPIEDSFGNARSIIKDLRSDAKHGAGELTDYIQGYNRILGPALAAGANASQIRNLTKNSIAAGFAMRGQEGANFAPMDVMQALTSGAEARSTPFVKMALDSIGVTTAKFNAMTDAKKITVLDQAFGKFGSGVKLMSMGWDAQMSTLKDNIKDLVRTVGKPIFDRWTDKLRDANMWLERNEKRIESIADKIGTNIANAWDSAFKNARAYGALAAVGGAARLGMPVASSIGSAVGGGAAGAASIPSMLFGATILAVVAEGALGVYGAFSEWPELFSILAPLGADIAVQFHGLVDAFGSWTANGSILNRLGFVIIGTAYGAGLLVDALIRVTTVMTRLFGMLLQFGGIFVDTLGGATNGKARARSEFTDASGDISRALGFSQMPGSVQAAILAAKGRSASAMAAGKTPAVTKQGDNIFNGPITINAKTEVNQDPARVAMAFDEFLEHTNRYRKTARNGVGPPRF